MQELADEYKKNQDLPIISSDLFPYLKQKGYLSLTKALLVDINSVCETCIHYNCKISKKMQICT